MKKWHKEFKKIEKGSGEPPQIKSPFKQVFSLNGDLIIATVDTVALLAKEKIGFPPV